jgi:hypothetical protein
VNAFFDNCTSPTLAATISGFVDHLVQLAIHIRDAAAAGLPLQRDAEDVEWIAALAADARPWVVVTGDRRLTRNKAEKEAFRRARLSGFLLGSRFTKLAINHQAAILIYRWPELIDTVQRFNPPLLIDVPARFGSKLDVIRW